MSKKKETQATEHQWDRQPGEGVKAFEAFNTYLLMGTERSLSKVAQELHKSRTLMAKWSGLWNWVERAAAWDVEQEKLARKEQIEEIKKMRKRHAMMSAKVLTAANLGLNNLLKDIQQGKATMTPNDLSRMVDIGMKYERLSRGDTSEIVEERDGGQAPDLVQIYIPDNKRNDDDTFDDLKV